MRKTHITVLYAMKPSVIKPRLVGQRTIFDIFNRFTPYAPIRFTYAFNAHLFSLSLVHIATADRHARAPSLTAIKKPVHRNAQAANTAILLL